MDKRCVCVQFVDFQRFFLETLGFRNASYSCVTVSSFHLDPSRILFLDVSSWCLLFPCLGIYLYIAKVFEQKQYFYYIFSD